MIFRKRKTMNTIKDNIELIREFRKALLEDNILYESFISSAYSALKEIPADMDLKDAARIVIDRIIGRE